MAMDPYLLLPPAVMAQVDADTIAAGTPGTVLMERAGRAVAQAVVERFSPRPVHLLCGPGNNGGDGFVAARRLRAAGWPVRLACLVPIDRLKGDAAWAASCFDGPVEPLTPGFLEGAGVAVDALFGAGLSRDIEGTAREVIACLLERRTPVVAVDVPSGVDGATGRVRGIAPKATVTVTFGCAKPGHFLLPGRLHCGELRIADIGLEEAALRAHDLGLRRNHPDLWRHLLRRRTPLDHKYRFGHAYVVGGPAATTGAARMAAEAALRIGAGLVSVVCEDTALSIYACHLTTVMTKPFAGEDQFRERLRDPRVTALLIGPGAGVSEATRRRTEEVLGTGRPTVLDADALTVFRDRPEELFALLRANCVLTPHDGEYARLFPFSGDRLKRARSAAERSGAIVLLKGGDTVVAAPDGRATILADAPAELATAGTGDVLAGILTGLLAQGMPAFEAACAATWIHAEAARRLARPFIAEELPSALPNVLQAMWEDVPPSQRS